MKANSILNPTSKAFEAWLEMSSLSSMVAHPRVRNVIRRAATDAGESERLEASL